MARVPILSHMITAINNINSSRRWFVRADIEAILARALVLKLNQVLVVVVGSFR